MSVDDGEVLRVLACEGAGLALLPSFWIENDVRDRRLALVLPEWSLPELAVHVVHAYGTSAPPHVRALVDALAQRSRRSLLGAR